MRQGQAYEVEQRQVAESLLRIHYRGILGFAKTLDEMIKYRSPLPPIPLPPRLVYCSKDQGF